VRGVSRSRRRSNVTRKLNTPGGKLVLQYTAKKAKGPQTPAGDQGRIHGVRARTNRAQRRRQAAGSRSAKP
jgi:large subunit ribosomal protein L34e